MMTTFPSRPFLFFSVTRTSFEPFVLTLELVHDMYRIRIPQIDEVDTKVSKMDTKVDALEKKMNQMVDGVSTTKAFANADHWRFWQILPLLFNGSTGHCAWAPVTYTHSTDNKERDVVVVSLPMVEHMCFQYYSDVARCKEELGTILKSGISRVVLDEGKMYMEDFITIMSKTPFRPYAHGLDKARVTGNNVHRYYIVDSGKWKKLMGEIHENFPDRPLKLPLGFESTKMDLTTMSHRYAVVAHSPGNNSTAQIPCLGNKVLDLEERKACPAMGIPWWKESYKSGADKYFGMKIGEKEGVCHVVNGSTTTSEDDVGAVVIRSFDEILQALEKNDMLTYEYPDDESDSDSEAESDDKSPGKKRGKGKAQERKQRAKKPRLRSSTN